MQDLKVVLDIGNLYIKGVVFAKDEWKTIVLAKDTAFSNGCIFLVKVPKGTKKGSIIQRLSDGNQMMDLEVIQTDIHSA
jgi:hypothetical protein